MKLIEKNSVKSYPLTTTEFVLLYVMLFMLSFAIFSHVMMPNLEL